MKNNPKFLNLVLIFALLLILLAACGPKVKFVAPEIEPPADLIPGYIPEGFKLIKGYQIKPENFEVSHFFADGENCDEETRNNCGLELSDFFFNLQSPDGNDILGLHYQDGNNLLLITKSYYPGGSLDLWRAAYDAPGEDTQECDCDCFPFVIDRRLPPFPLRFAEIQEMRTVSGTQVAILNGASGLTTIFIRGDDLLTVESGVSLEENLRIVESLLEN